MHARLCKPRRQMERLDEIPSSVRSSCLWIATCPTQARRRSTVFASTFGFLHGSAGGSLIKGKDLLRCADRMGQAIRGSIRWMSWCMVPDTPGRFARALSAKKNGRRWSSPKSAFRFSSETHSGSGDVLRRSTRTGDPPSPRDHERAGADPSGARLQTTQASTRACKPTTTQRKEVSHGRG